MPYVVTTFALPCGTTATRAVGSGVITREAADELMKQIGPGGANYHQPLLVLTQQMKSMSPEARKIFSSADPTDAQAWCAVVVTNPVIRVSMNFLLRVSRAPTIKLFSSEPDAIAWLDERVRVDGPTVPARQAPRQG